MIDIALATCSAYPDLHPYDSPVIGALARLGLTARPVVWDDEAGWEGVGACIVRTTWDYFHRADAFLAWAERLAERVPMWNPPALLRWNASKTYLADLAERGVPIIPTAWLERGARVDLAELMAARGWDDMVLKPVVGGGAFGTLRVRPGQAAEKQPDLDLWLTERGMLAQPYWPSVEHPGERSVIAIEGEVTHGVQRVPALGDGDAHPEGYAPVALAPDEVAFAGRVLAALESTPLYARVDMVRDAQGALTLMELELIEPSLFLIGQEAAAARFAEAIARRLQAVPASTGA